MPMLPSGRESFSPDASYYNGPFPADDMRFIEGPPTFAVEVRSEGDCGAAADLEYADKRTDYFQAGTAVVVRVSLRDVMVIHLDALKGASPELVMRTCVELGHALGNQHWPALVKEGVVYVPLTVVTGYYGMNFALPEYRWPHSEIYALGVMVVTALVTWLYLRWRRWRGLKSDSASSAASTERVLHRV